MEDDDPSKDSQGKFLMGLTISLLIGGNIFFAKRLVDDVDVLKKGFTELHDAVIVMNYRLEQRLLMERKQCELHENH